MIKKWNECIDCPEILTEKYGSGQNKCAECLEKSKKDSKVEVDRIAVNEEQHND